MEEYLKAKKIVEKYEKSIKDSLVKDHICSVCNKKCEEVHHLNPQEKANEHGFIKNKQL
jgi:hypothetical protein